MRCKSFECLLIRAAAGLCQTHVLDAVLDAKRVYLLAVLVGMQVQAAFVQP